MQKVPVRVSLSTSMLMAMKKNLILAIWMLPKHVYVELYDAWFSN